MTQWREPPGIYRRPRPKRGLARLSWFWRILVALLLIGAAAVAGAVIRGHNGTALTGGSSPTTSSTAVTTSTTTSTTTLDNPDESPQAQQAVQTVYDGCKDVYFLQVQVRQAGNDPAEVATVKGSALAAVVLMSNSPVPLYHQIGVDSSAVGQDFGEFARTDNPASLVAAVAKVAQDCTNAGQATR